MKNLKGGTQIEDKQKFKTGITLIALVITIIVLLILAAISITMLTGDNSLLKRAVEAKEKTGIAGTKEQIQMEVLESYATENLEIVMLIM